MLPDWWERRSGADVSAALLRSVGASLDAGLTGRMQRATADLQASVQGLHGAAGHWWEAQQMAAAKLDREVRQQLPYTGSARDDLTARLDRLAAARARLEDVPDVGPIQASLDQARRVSKAGGRLTLLEADLSARLVALAEDMGRAAAGMADLAEAMDELRRSFKATPWIRARDELGDVRGEFTPEQVSAVMGLADRLRPPSEQRASPSARQPDAELLRGLAREIGLHHQGSLAELATVRDRGPDLRQLVRLLDLARDVFERPSLDDVRNLRRLLDLLPGRAGLNAGVTLNVIRNTLGTTLRDFVRPPRGEPPLSRQQQVRALVRMVARAKEARGPGNRVTLADLTALQLSDQRAPRAQEYLDAAPGLRLTRARRDEMIGELLRGLPTHEALRAALGLLNSATAAELTRLMRGGQIGGLLVRRIGPDHPLRPELNRFVVQRFGPSVRPQDLGAGQYNPMVSSPVALQRRPFAPDLLSPALLGIGLPADLPRPAEELAALRGRATALLAGTAHALSDAEQITAMTLAERLLAGLLIRAGGQLRRGPPAGRGRADRPRLAVGRR